MAKPAAAFNWADTPPTLRTEPPAGLKNTGFSVLTKLPAQFFNWLFGIVADWLIWLNTRLFDAYTIPTMGQDCRLVGDAATGMTIQNTAGTKLPGSGAEPTVATNFATKGYVDARAATYAATYYSAATWVIPFSGVLQYFDWSTFTAEVEQGIDVSGGDGTKIVFPANGIYRVSAHFVWGPAPLGVPFGEYARNLWIEAPLVTHRDYRMAHEVAGVAGTWDSQEMTFIFKVTDYTTQFLKIAASQANGAVADTLETCLVSVEWVNGIV